MRGDSDTAFIDYSKRKPSVSSSGNQRRRSSSAGSAAARRRRDTPAELDSAHDHTLAADDGDDGTGVRDAGMPARGEDERGTGPRMNGDAHHHHRRRSSIKSWTTPAHDTSPEKRGGDDGMIDYSRPAGATRRSPTSTSSRASALLPTPPLSDASTPLSERAPAPPPPVASPRAGKQVALLTPDTSDDDDDSVARSSTKKPTRPASDGHLTPQDRHYLNKAFVYLQIQREFSSLSKVGDLVHYGDPFLPHPSGPNSRPPKAVQKSGYLGFLGSGGGPKRAPGWEDFVWTDEGDSPALRYMFWRFVYNFPALREAKPTYWRDHIQPFFDSFAERDLSTTRERSEVTKRRLLSMGLTRILGTYYHTCMTPVGAHAPARPRTKVMRRLDHLLPGTMESMWHTEFPRDRIAYNAWTAIIQGAVDDADDYLIVSRVIVTEPEQRFVVRRSYSAFTAFAKSLAQVDPHHTLDLPILPDDARGPLQHYLRLLVISLSAPPSDTDPAPARALLEKFLLGQPEDYSKRDVSAFIAQAEEEDGKAEKVRKVWIKVGKRARALRTTWALYRRALIEGDEVDKSIELVRRTPMIKNLPESHRDAQEWARIWVAYALHFLFAGSPNAQEATGLLKSFHSMVPYGALKLGLSLVNPTLAIKAVVAIVLGQPGGQPSLFQRIFSIVVGGKIRGQKKGIAALRKKLPNHQGICDAIVAHVYAPFDQRAMTREESSSAEEDILLTLVRDHGSATDAKLVASWHREFVRRGPGDEDSTDAGKFQTLKNLLRAECVKRDSEQVLEIVMEHNTPVLLRESVAVFYSAIYKIADASKLADRLGDLQAFIDDLLAVALSDNKEPSDFIKLAARHDQDLYFFVHELASNGGTLLDPLLDWCKSGLAFIKNGIPPASAQSHRRNSFKSGPTKGPRAGVDYDKLLASAPADTRAAVLDEVRGLALWTSYKKCWADICLRVDLLAVDGVDLGIDKGALYSELLAQDHEVLDAIERQGPTTATPADRRPEDGVTWAWFADDDVLNNPTSIKVDWKAAAAAEKAALESRKQSRGKLFRKSSRVSHAESKVSKVENEPTKHVPEPKVRAIKSLLDEYQNIIKASMDAAWNAKLK